MHRPKQWLLSFSRNEIKLMLKYINGSSPRAKKQQSCYKWLIHYVSHTSEGRVWGLCVITPRRTWARLLPDLSARVPHHTPVWPDALTTNAVLSHLSWKEHSVGKEGSWWESLPRQQGPRKKLAYAKTCQNATSYTSPSQERECKAYDDITVTKMDSTICLSSCPDRLEMLCTLRSLLGSGKYRCFGSTALVSTVPSRGTLLAPLQQCPALAFSPLRCWPNSEYSLYSDSSWARCSFSVGSSLLTRNHPKFWLP